MEKHELRHLIEVASGRKAADLVLKNAKIIEVFNEKIIEGDVAIAGEYIAGIGNYKGEKEIDIEGKYLSPGFIDSHIHIESSYVTPEELGKLLVPLGCTTIISDPHEIVNVCGFEGLDYMIKAAKNTKLDIKYTLPSCVPATPFETSGCELEAKDMEEAILKEEIIGLGEFMNFPGVINNNSEIIDKIMTANKAGKIIDGHAPLVDGKELNAYMCAGIKTDHECTTVKEMEERISVGGYVLLRQGSASQDLKILVKGITLENSRRCLFCSDDCQTKTIFEVGHINNHLRICVEEGIDPITAIKIATINGAECYKLEKKGAIAPGFYADLVVLEDLKNFKALKVFTKGELASEKGQYLPKYEVEDFTRVKGTIKINDFSKEKLNLKAKSTKVNAIELIENSIVTKKTVENIKITEHGNFIYNPDEDIAKIAVIERHKMTGNVSVGLIKGYGIKRGAIATSIAHDSHNIIVVGTSDEDIEYAVQCIKKQDGGIVVVNNQKVLENMPMPIGGIISDKPGEWVYEKLKNIHQKAYETLGVNKSVEPVMALSFMSLAVIPEIKITDKGIFDVEKFEFMPISIEDVKNQRNQAINFMQ